MTADFEPAADLLATIVAATRHTVRAREARDPLEAVASRAAERSQATGRFIAAVCRRDRVNVIAECKRRSPSRGVLRPSYAPALIAESYEQAGAAAISVLTEPGFFDGSLDHLEAVRDAVSVPVLRKDFVVSEYQLFEAKAAGADAVLLIVAALDPDTLAALLERASALGLDALVEIHEGSELATALSCGARLIGVNNRNLRTLEVDVHASRTLIGRIPSDVVSISESGLRSPDDLLELRELGYRGFLMGERFMQAPDPGAELAALLRACPVDAPSPRSVR